MEPDQVVREFTHQSESFNVAPVMRSADTLGRLVDLIPAAPGARWLDAACGPGLVARGLAPRVGDAAALDFADASFDGAVTRFSLHHVRVPGRVVAEMARVVRPGGAVVVAD